MLPVGVAPAFALARWHWLSAIASEPLRHVVGVELLRPEHASEGLALHQPLIIAQGGGLEGGVEGVGLACALRECRIEY